MFLLERTSVRLIAIAAVVLFTASAGASSYALFRCRGDGVTRTRCCCPSRSSSNPPPADRVGRGSCCESVRVRVDAEASTIARSGDIGVHLARAISIEIPSPFFVSAPAKTSAKRVHRDRAGPPLLLQKCVLLV